MLALTLWLLTGCGGGAEGGREKAAAPEEATTAQAAGEGAIGGQSPQEGWATASPERKAELQAEAQRAGAFEGKREDLEMGDTAHWRSGFHLRLSNPHLARCRTERCLPQTQTSQGADWGKPALVVQLEMWYDGQGTIELDGGLPCAARDLNGVPLQSTRAVPEVNQGPQIFSTPLEPGQERSKAIAYQLPKQGSEVTLKCSLAYATGVSTILFGPEPPREDTATWTVDVSELPQP